MAGFICVVKTCLISSWLVLYIIITYTIILKVPGIKVWKINHAENADKVTFHLNTSSTMGEKKNLCKVVSCLEVLGEIVLMLFIVFCLVWWPCFLISKQHLRWFLLQYIESSHQKSQKNMTKLLVPKSACVWNKNTGMMLWSCQALLILTVQYFLILNFAYCIASRYPNTVGCLSTYAYTLKLMHISPVIKCMGLKIMFTGVTLFFATKSSVCLLGVFFEHF